MTRTRVPELLVVVGPQVVADTGLLRTLTDSACAQLGVPGRLVTVASADDLTAVVAGADGPLVALPGPTPAIRAGMTAAPATVVWYDLTVETPVQGVAHLHGRGVWGLVWAIRHAVYRFRRPARRIAYGPDADQWGELRLPASAPTGPVPVAVLLHGGFWRSVWGADLMDALAVDLAERGWATWNLEYRRPDRHGWDSTTADVVAGVTALAALADGRPLDLDRVVLFGHSAGGQLALRLAADRPPVRVALAVSLAGVLDLAEGQRRYLGDGAVTAALGGTPATVPHRYAASDPLARLPIGVPTVLVQGTGDGPDLVDINRRYAAAARAAGDDLTHLEQLGDHFDVISADAAIWRATMVEVDRRIRG